jgi:hypothetical protein
LRPDPLKTPTLLLAVVGFGAPGLAAATPAPTIWTFGNLHEVGGYTPEILGSPEPRPGGSVHCNGADQGLIVPVNPIAGWPAFTVAVLFRPEDDAPEAQRFLHIEDANGKRLTVEDRVLKGRGWYMDTFLLDSAGSAAHGRTLIDPAKLHPLGRWYWAELVYDGRTMASFVDGAAELSGAVAFSPGGPGRTSVGVRLNHVYWFKGEIREVRFYPEALAPADLPKAANPSP